MTMLISVRERAQHSHLGEIEDAPHPLNERALAIGN